MQHLRALVVDRRGPGVLTACLVASVELANATLSLVTSNEDVRIVFVATLAEAELHAVITA